jgi:hypothetical protein
MMSAAVSLGMILLWDVDGGLMQIDKYLYSKEDYIKAGALLAMGIANSGVRNDCDPALALLSTKIMTTLPRTCLAWSWRPDSSPPTPDSSLGLGLLFLSTCSATLLIFNFIFVFLFLFRYNFQSPGRRRAGSLAW